MPKSCLTIDFYMKNSKFYSFQRKETFEKSEQEKKLNTFCLKILSCEHFTAVSSD